MGEAFPPPSCECSASQCRKLRWSQCQRGIALQCKGFKFCAPFVCRVQWYTFSCTNSTSSHGDKCSICACRKGLLIIYWSTFEKQVGHRNDGMLHSMTSPASQFATKLWNIPRPAIKCRAPTFYKCQTLSGQNISIFSAGLKNLCVRCFSFEMIHLKSCFLGHSRVC